MSPEWTTRQPELVALGRWLQQAGYRFVPVTPATHARVNGRAGAAWAADIRDVFGWSRPFRREHLPGGLFERMERAGVLARTGDGWRSVLRAATLDGALFFHSAFPTTEDEAVFFGPDTYRFAAAIQALLTSASRPIQRAVDIGTGAGPGAILIGKHATTVEVVAGDINASALALCRVNAELAGLDNVRAAQSDLLDGTSGEFDLIVANPPYLIDSALRRYRHGGGALGEGLALSILDAALPRLRPGGELLLYTGSVIVDGRDVFLDAVTESLAGRSDVSWNYRETDPDVFGEELDEPAYAKAERIAAVVLVASRSTATQRASPLQRRDGVAGT